MTAIAPNPSEFYPIWVLAPEVESLASLRVVDQWDTVCAISGSPSLIESLLRFSGRKSLADHMISSGEPRLVHDAAMQLLELGAICDARMLIGEVHRITNNPMPFAASLSDAEIAALMERPFRDVESSQQIPLRADGLSRVGLLHQSRASCRAFSSAELSLDDLGALLLSTYSTARTPIASAGGLYPLEIYVVAHRVQELQDWSVYRFNHVNETLEHIAKDCDRELVALAVDCEWILDASALVIFCADFSVHERKYANRGYRYTLIEVGQAVQAMTSAALDRDVVLTEYGGFDDGRVTELTTGDRVVAPILVAGLGKPAALSSPRPDSTVALQEAWGLEVEPVLWGHLDRVPFRQCVSRRSGSSSFSSGTASTSELARTRAVAEAIERLACSLPPVSIQAAAADLEGDWLDVRRGFPLTRQQRQGLGLSTFRTADSIDWVEGQTGAGIRKWVPIELCCYPYEELGFTRSPLVRTSSNGVAAHQDRELARLGALAELVERDCIIRNWAAGMSPKLISPSLLEAGGSRRIEFLESAGYEVAIADISAHGTAVVSAMAVSKTLRPIFSQGSAASFSDPQAAVVKALEECILGVVHQRDKVVRYVRPELVDTPEDHGLLYNSDDHLERLLYLFDGPRDCGLPMPSGIPDELKKSSTFVDIYAGEHDIHVVRALNEGLVPIAFGFGADHYTHEKMARSGPNFMQGGTLFPHHLA